MDDRAGGHGYPSLLDAPAPTEIAGGTVGVKGSRPLSFEVPGEALDRLLLNLSVG
jgi:hypothetical protein